MKTLTRSELADLPIVDGVPVRIVHPSGMEDTLPLPVVAWRCSAEELAALMAGDLVTLSDGTKLERDRVQP